MNSEQKRAAMYTRSAASQEPGEENNALATQIRLCRLHCQVEGYATDEKHIYSEIGSGNDGYNRRPQLTALLEAAKLGAFDVLVIATHNRLSRRKLPPQPSLMNCNNTASRLRA